MDILNLHYISLFSYDKLENKREVVVMQRCPECDKVYDESEYSHCPYCSGELEDNTSEKYFKNCPNCDGIMYWDDYWECTNCGHEIYSDEDDNDGIIEC